MLERRTERQARYKGLEQTTSVAVKDRLLRPAAARHTSAMQLCCNTRGHPEETPKTAVYALAEHLIRSGWSIEVGFYFARDPFDTVRRRCSFLSLMADSNRLLRVNALARTRSRVASALSVRASRSLLTCGERDCAAAADTAASPPHRASHHEDATSGSMSRARTRINQAAAPLRRCEGHAAKFCPAAQPAMAAGRRARARGPPHSASFAVSACKRMAPPSSSR
jgi:hypothetical protein